MKKVNKLLNEANEKLGKAKNAVLLLADDHKELTENEVTRRIMKIYDLLR